MTLKELCMTCKCGICCFMENDFKGHLMRFPSGEFIMNNSTKIKYILNFYYTAINKNFSLSLNDTIRYACAFLEPEILNEQVIKMKCSIHENMHRPKACFEYIPDENEDYYIHEARIKGIKEISYNGKKYTINPELEAILNKK